MLEETPVQTDKAIPCVAFQNKNTFLSYMIRYTLYICFTLVCIRSSSQP